MKLIAIILINSIVNKIKFIYKVKLIKASLTIKNMINMMTQIL